MIKLTKEKGIALGMALMSSKLLKLMMLWCLLTGININIQFAYRVFLEASKIRIINIEKVEKVSITSSAKPLIFNKVEEVPVKKGVTIPIKKEIVKYKGEKMTDYQIAMWLLKSCESLRPKAYWDVNQWTSGWGTKSKQGEVISLKEANKRASKEYNRVYTDLTKRYPKLDRWTKLILTVADYNVGHFGEQLDSAIKSGNKKEIARVLKLYIHDANGKKLDGLVTRRNKEAALILANENEKQELGRIIKKKVLSSIKKNKIR